MKIEKFQNWLKQLGKAWSDLDPQTAANLFAKDVEYYESTLKDPIESWDRVLDLWKIIPNNQKDVSFRFKIISTTGNLCVANWWVERTLLPQNIKQKIDGIFVFKLNEDGLCDYFKQWRTAEDSAS